MLRKRPTFVAQVDTPVKRRTAALTAASALLMVGLATAFAPATAQYHTPESLAYPYVQRISLVTGDIELSRRLWVEAFGYRVIFDGPGMRGERLARAQNLDEGALAHLMILAPPEGIIAPYVDLSGAIGQQLKPLRTDPPGSPPRAGDHRLVVFVPDIHATFEKIEELGLQILMPPTDMRGAEVEPGAFGAVSAPDFEAVLVSPDGTRILVMSVADGVVENCYLFCAE